MENQNQNERQKPKPKKQVSVQKTWNSSYNKSPHQVSQLPKNNSKQKQRKCI